MILFPSLPFSTREIDPDYEDERSAARAAGIQVALVDHTRITEGKLESALSAVPAGSAAAIYRGWMLTPSQYQSLYESLAKKGVSLINTPATYRTCHYLPDSYAYIEGRTPASVWLPVEGAVDFEAVANILKPFGSRALVLKDYVKSQKHYWAEACFIPSAADRASVERVVRRFLELQGGDLNVGLVFREYVPLKTLAKHPKSGMPMAAEFRIFWLDGEPLLSHRYWGDLTTFDAPLPFAELLPIAARIPSRFFTMDVAFLDDGSWTIVELGDGQVAGLPSQDLAPEFFRRIGASGASRA